MPDILYGEFEWDKLKARRNYKKHRVSFIEATTVFGDPLFVGYPSWEHSSTEYRYVIIGESQRRRLLAVAYTERGPRTRIISARLVTSKERKKHEESEKEFS
jgi:uncharacterized protein